MKFPLSTPRPSVAPAATNKLLVAPPWGPLVLDVACMSLSKQPALVALATSDLNWGEQALVWEAATLALDTGLYNDLAILEAATPAEPSQAENPQTAALGNRLYHGLFHSKVPASLPANGAASYRYPQPHGFSQWLAERLLRYSPWPKLSRCLLSAPFQDTLSALENCRALFVKGSEFCVAPVGSAHAHYLELTLDYVRLARRLGKPVYVLPSSVCTRLNEPEGGALRADLGLCNWISARDHASAKLLSLALQREVPLGVDLTYFMSAAPSEVGQDACLEAGVPLGSQPCAALAISPLALWDSLGAFPDASATAGLTSLLQAVSTTGWHVVLLLQAAPQQLQTPWQTWLSSLEAGLSGVAHSRMEHRGDCSDLKSSLGWMQAVLATDPGSLALSQGAGVPTFALLPRHSWGVQTLHDQGLQEFCLSWETLAQSNFSRLIHGWTDASSGYQARLSAWLRTAEQRRGLLLDQLRHAQPPSAFAAVARV